MLVARPFCLSFEQIERLDRWQVIGIHLTPRDRDGTVLASGGTGRTLSVRQQFEQFWTQRGIPAWRVEEIWQAHQAEQQALRQEAQQARQELMARARQRRQHGRHQP